MAVRSLDFAFDCGASAVSLIPTRSGNGAMEALAEKGDFRRRRARDTRAQPRAGAGDVAAEPTGASSPTSGISNGFPTVRTACDARRDGCTRMNLEQRVAAGRRCAALREPRVVTHACSTSTSPSSAPVSPAALAALACAGAASAWCCSSAAATRASRSASRPRRWPTCCSRSWPIATTCRGFCRSRSGEPGSAPSRIACGLKRGFTFFFHRSGRPFADDGRPWRQLLVAASPHDEIADTHWYRPDFDHALVREAQAAGAVYLDETRLERHPRRRATGRARRHARRRDGRDHAPASSSMRAGRAAFCTDARHRRRAASLAPATRRASTRTSRASSAGTTDVAPDGTPPYPPTTPRCITCFQAAGSGCCASTTASRAPARR